MASLAPELIRLDPQTVAVDPPGECPVCRAPVPVVASEITALARDGGKGPSGVRMLVSIADFTVVAQPCGHVIHAWRKDQDD